MEPIKDFASSMKLAAMERLGSPLIGGFVLAWCGWNYRFFVILFSKNSAIDTFALIDGVIFPDWRCILFRGIVAPLASALLYIFFYPYPANYIYGYRLQKQLDANALKQKIEGGHLLSRQESDELRSKLQKSEAEAQSTISDVQTRLKEANGTLDQLQSMFLKLLQNNSSSLGQVVANLFPEHKDLISSLDRNGGRATCESLRQGANLNNDSFNRRVRELEGMKLVEMEHRSSSSDEDRVRLLDLGKDAAAILRSA